MVINQDWSKIYSSRMKCRRLFQYKDAMLPTKRFHHKDKNFSWSHDCLILIMGNPIPGQLSSHWKGHLSSRIRPARLGCNALGAHVTGATFHHFPKAIDSPLAKPWRQANCLPLGLCKETVKESMILLTNGCKPGKRNLMDRKLPTWRWRPQRQRVEIGRCRY